MEPRREQALVGLFVLMAAGVLIATVFAITGAFGPTAKTYHAHFPFAGGLEPGAIVRYSGGPKVGRVEQLRINPQDPGQIDVTFSVRSDLPVKTDSKVKIMSMSPLADTRALVRDSRPQLHSAIDHVNALTEKVEPLLQDFRKTSAEATQVLTHIDELVGENRGDVRQAVVELRGTLRELTGLMARLDQTLDVNSENVDELLDNLLHVTENLKEFTATIKSRPYTLIRATNPREHKPGEQQ